MSSSDTLQITNNLNLYALAVDTQRWDLFDRIFTSDVDSTYPGALHYLDLASFKRDFADIHAPLEASQHTMSNHQIAIDGDEAVSVTYGHWRLIRKVPGGRDCWEGAGWYDDHHVRTPDGWRIAKRACYLIWAGENAFMAVAETKPGEPDRNPHSILRHAQENRIPYLKTLSEN